MEHQIAEVALTYKTNVPIEQMPGIRGPKDAVKVLRSVWNTDTIQLREEFVVLLLTNNKRCLGSSKISSGGATATIVDPAAILQTAILGNARSIILSHNHPSGSLRASKTDIDLTKRLQEAGKMLGIGVDDHIILSANGYFSFQEEGLM